MKNIFFGPLKRWRKKDWNHWDDSKKIVEYCDSKIIYHTMAEAQEKKKIQEEKSGHPLFIYECPHGPHMHLTKKVSYY